MPELPEPKPSAVRGRKALALTRLSMAAERAWPPILLTSCIAAAFAAAAWSGLFRMAPDAVRFALVAAFAAGAAASLLGLRGVRMPGGRETAARVEKANGLVHSPIAAQADTLSPTSRDAFAQALWNEHLRRMKAAAADARPDLPRPGVPERDPWGLRAAAALACITAFAYSHGPHGGRIADAFAPPSRTAAAETASHRVDAWISPPAHTGRAPVFLSLPSGGSPQETAVPEGSRAAVRITGGDGGTAAYWLGASSGAREAVTESGGPAGSRVFSFDVGEAGILSLRSGDARVAAWVIEAIPDRPPAIAFTAPPAATASGTLELAYAASDDYGITSVRARISPHGLPATAVPLYPDAEIALPLPRDPRSGTARVRTDLLQHPWAGAAVTVTLEAEDASGQTGSSGPVTAVLPARTFRDPVAEELAYHRRSLALDAGAAQHVLRSLEALTDRPAAFSRLSHYLAVSSARARLSGVRDMDGLREVSDYLWTIATAIEDGAAAATRDRLAIAAEALRQAILAGAGEAELSRLTEELRRAAEDHLRALAGNGAPGTEGAGPQVRPEELAGMIDRLSDAAGSGAAEAALGMLSSFEELMRNLRAAPRSPAAENPAGSRLERLGDIMRRQQEAMDEAHRSGQAEGGEEGGTLETLSGRQAEIARELGDLAREIEEAGLGPAGALKEAEAAMDGAGSALGEGRTEEAVSDQGRAMEALMEGARELARRLGEQSGEGPSGGLDPLGRQAGPAAGGEGEGVRIPDEFEIREGRRIRDEIRRRLDRRDAPAVETDYLERLLRPLRLPSGP